MRLSILILGLIISSFTHAEPITVATLDIDRYLGRWYEIASFPMYFQHMCVADTTAEYSKADDRINVVNRCRKQDGSFAEADGYASVVPHSGNAN
ncbi:hypothetical protein VN23_14895 [Janthinobacterium sp. B9-8]|nr:hypothetical protein VN23_14895 [Janthinobacterium sp. B9-8]